MTPIRRHVVGIALAMAVAVPVAPPLAQSPDYDARLERGVELFSQGKHAEASVFFSNLTRTDPERKEAFLWLGQAFARQGDLTKARDALRRYAELSPDDAEGPREVAKTYESEGNVALATLWYRRALEADANDAQSRNALQRLSDADPPGPPGGGSEPPATTTEAPAPAETRTGFWRTGLAGVTGARTVWWGHALVLLFFIGGMVQGVSNVPQLRRTNPYVPPAVLAVTGLAGAAFWYVIFWGFPSGSQWAWLAVFLVIQAIGLSGALRTADG